MPLTKDLVIRYHRGLSKVYGVTFFDITKEQELAKDALYKLHGKKFDLPKNWSLTLNDLIFLGYEIGEGNQQELQKQLEIFAHELVHAQQYLEYDIAEFVYLYMTNPSFRARMEAKANAAKLDIHYCLTGELMNTQRIIDGMGLYLLSKENLQTVKTSLDISNKIIAKQKRPISPTGIVAVNYLNGQF